MIWKIEFSAYFYALKNRLMNQPPPFTFGITSCVNPTSLGWIHATAVWLKSIDKADFHAMGAMEGVA
jgi:hypothetical protein